MTVLPVAYQKLLEITRYITAITEPGELFQKLIDAAVEMTGAERGYLLLKRGPTDDQLPLGGLHPVAACRMIEEELESEQFRASRTAIMKAFNEGQRAYWTGGISGELRSHSMEIMGLRSIVCEPLKVHDEVLGVLYLDSSTTRKFSDDHKEILPSFAAQAAICVENIRLIDAREEALRREHTEQARALELQVYKETMSSFMSIASHDLKGPLTVMKTGMALLKRTSPSDGQLGLIGDIEQAVERASRLVSTYLDIQKLEEGHQLALSPRPVDLRKLLQAEINMTLAPLEEHRREAFSVVMEVSENARVTGDSARLSQIFGNLIENAVKYSPQGGVIRLEWKREGSFDVVSISDQGLGMSEEGLTKLFARFVRLEQDQSIRGTGLGLFIVRRLVESHGGKIEVESREGDGTTFRVLLPIL
ncbi:MAG: ATP-binding protein [Vulcanimicrobiota bacterium]